MSLSYPARNVSNDPRFYLTMYYLHVILGKMILSLFLSTLCFCTLMHSFGSSLLHIDQVVKHLQPILYTGSKYIRAHKMSSTETYTILNVLLHLPHLR